MLESSRSRREVVITGYPHSNLEMCALNCFVSWDAILATIPSAMILSAPLVQTGSGTPGAVGNADNLNVNGTIYNIEPDAKPPLASIVPEWGGEATQPERGLYVRCCVNCLLK
jgi:hypothetical protein